MSQPNDPSFADAFYPDELFAGGVVVVLALLWLGFQAARPPPTSPFEPVRVDLNLAAPPTLTVLPGVGPKTALRIARGRPYRRIEELRPVVGERVFARIASYVVVGAGEPIVPRSDE